jgi:membrane protein YqaA with SNARE-associated domain
LLQFLAFHFWNLTFIFATKFKFLAEITQKLQDYGAWGILILALLDSTFVPIPSGPDIALITLAVSLQSPPLQIAQFALAASIGSVIGCVILYLIARKGGERILQRIKPQKREYVQNLLGRYDALAVIGACLMPPPFPFKPFILISGVLNFKLPRLIGALLIGRSLRYLILGTLVFYFGAAAREIITTYGIRILLAFAITALIAFLLHYFAKKPATIS